MRRTKERVIASKMGSISPLSECKIVSFRLQLCSILTLWLTFQAKQLA